MPAPCSSWHFHVHVQPAVVGRANLHGCDQAVNLMLPECFQRDMIPGGCWRTTVFRGWNRAADACTLQQLAFVMCMYSLQLLVVQICTAAIGL